MTAADQNLYGKRANAQPSRAFLNELHRHKTEVYQYAMDLERSDSIAAFVFDLLVRLAQHNHTFIDRSLIQRLSDQLERFEEPISEVNIPLMEGMVLTLEQALTLGAPPPSTYDILNSFFARGYHIYLDTKTAKERQEFASKVIKLLPSIERLGPFRLSDFVDYACSGDEALRFWQLYVERVAAEVERRTQQSERDPHTWTLSALLKTHEIGPNALIGKRWEVLRRHIERIMQSRQEERRWRYLRLILESCRDYRALYFILNSPSVIEDQTIPFIFLTRGNRKLQSCALFLLHTTKTRRTQVHQLLEYFEDRTLPEVGERAVELYAQTQLFEHPSPVIEVLAEGIVSIIAHKLQDEPLDPLLAAVTNDAHAFRQSLFLAEVIPSDRARNTPAQVQLLERVLQSFFHTFTPSGVRHPLNDKVFQRGVVKAIVELMRDQDTGHTAHLKSFGFTLDKAAKRWRPGDGEEEVAQRHLLLSYFIGLYVHVLRRAARHLHRKYETRPRALELYEVIINLYLRQPNACVDSGAYEEILPLMRSLFPEFTSDEYLEAPSKSRVERAVILLGEVEEERAPQESFRGLLDEWRERNRGRDMVEVEEGEDAHQEAQSEHEPLEVETRGHVPVVTTSPVRAPVRIYHSGKNSTLSTVRAYLGLEIAQHYLQRLLSLLGYTPKGELSLVGEEILLREEYQRADEHVAGQHLARFHVSQLSGVAIEQPLRAFYLFFGLIALVFFCFAGGHFLFAGVRGSEMELGLLGLGLIVFGFAVDVAASAIRERHTHEVVLRLHRHNNVRSLALGIDRESPQGQALLNAFMAESVRQREEQFIQSLAQAAEQQAISVQERESQEAESQDQLSEDEAAQAEVLGQDLQSGTILDSEDAEASKESSVNDDEESADEDSLDISFEDEDSMVQDASMEPSTVVPPVPSDIGGVDSTSDEGANDLDSSFDMLVGGGKSPKQPEEPEPAPVMASINPSLTDGSNLAEAFDFISSVGEVPEDSDNT